jgi:hypothetical protein
VISLLLSGDRQRTKLLPAFSAGSNLFWSLFFADEGRLLSLRIKTKDERITVVVCFATPPPTAKKVSSFCD